VARVDTTLYLLGMGLAVLVPAFVTVYGWRRREEPGALAFTGLVAAFALYAGLHLVGVLTHDPPARHVLEAVQLTVTAVTPVLWVVFALEYTGFDEYVTRRGLAGLSVIPAVFVAAVWTNPVHGLAFPDNGVVVVDGLALMHQELGPAFWVFTIFALACIGAGTVLHARLVLATDDLYLGQSVLLVVGITFVPLAMLASVLPTADGSPRLDYNAFGFAVAALAFGYAVFRHRLLDLVPAPRRLGRRSVVRSLGEGIAVLDGEEVVYCNEAAATALGRPRSAVLGAPIESVVDQPLADAPDAVGELETDGRIYELRTSPVLDRRENRIGTTVVFHDVTARIEKERELATQRDELATLDALNGLVGRINGMLALATSREEVETAVCRGLADGGRYRAARVADLATWNGDADRWRVAGDETVDPPPAGLTAETAGLPATAGTSRDGGWTVVPVAVGRTVYGALGVYTDREASERERTVLGDLGANVGHAIDAVETRRLLSAESVVELHLSSADGADPLVAATERADGRVEVSWDVPSGPPPLVYLRVDGAPATAVRARLEETGSASVRVVDEGLLEATVTADSPLGTLLEVGGHLERAVAEAGQVRYEVVVGSESRARTLVDRLERTFSSIAVVAKRERSGPAAEPAGIPGDTVEGLTDRQREVVETAYRAGYFNWPRDSTAEEVADSLDIAAPTFHAHLRKAESSLLDGLFDRLSGHPGRRVEPESVEEP
jgi:predicted DNA binding protein/PAS domain-containing protein